jgi:hypothetical protein
MNHALGEEVLKATCHAKGKDRRDEDHDAVAPRNSIKKKNEKGQNMQLHKENLVAAGKRKPRKPPANEAPGHFDKLLE